MCKYDISVEQLARWNAYLEKRIQRIDKLLLTWHLRMTEEEAIEYKHVIDVASSSYDTTYGVLR